jgi:uncharacterized protein (TIGR02284 family)
MAQSEWLSTVEHLIEICREGEQGYRIASSRARSLDFKEFYEQQSSERRHFAEELGSALSRLTETRTHDSIIAALHRGWIGLQASLGAGNQSILNSVLQGEQLTVQVYEDALNTPLPPQVENFVRTQAESIRRAYEQLSRMKEPAA